MESINNIMNEAFKSLEDFHDAPSIVLPKSKCKAFKEPAVKEAKEYSLDSESEAKEAKKAIAKASKKESNEEKIVDVDASTVDQLKDSYLGNAILQCPVCRTLIYKKPDALLKDEAQKGADADEVLYNVGEECPHCGSADGFNLVGQVANMDVKAEKAPSTTGIENPDSGIDGNADSGAEEPKDEDKESDETESSDNGGFLRTKPSNQEDEALSNVSELDDERINSLVEQFLDATYSNVKSFKTITGSVSGKTLIVEGVIVFKSGKSKATRFVFSGAERTGGGHCRLHGINEMFSEKPKSFGLLGKVEGKSFLGESLFYDYAVGDKKVKGRTFFRNRKS